MSSPEKLAIISDVHSNSYALAAVLDDIRGKGIKSIVNLGDSLYGPINPYSTYQILSQSNIISISGNQDRLILENLYIETTNHTLEFVKDKISANVREWLAKLPFELNLNEEVYCCHGSPQNDEEYLIEQVKKDKLVIRDIDQIKDKLVNIKQKLILCGHSHIPKSMWVGDKLLVNAGSVGLQAYEDDLPYYHKMENYSPHARYIVMTKTKSIYSADIIAVEYDFESAAAKAEINGRRDWAHSLRTGVVYSKHG